MPGSETDYGPQVPGSVDASHDEPAEEIIDLDLTEVYARATYAKTSGEDIEPEEALAIRETEHLCVTCYHAAVCRHAPAMEADALLIVISRCLSYSPA